jgi:hypothetical protein
MNKPLISLLVVAILFCFSSCKTYYISVDSFRQQFAGMDTSDLREVTPLGPAYSRVSYKTYPIDYIHAVDKQGNPVTLRNSPSIEIRFTDSSNKRTLFYFDLLRFDGTYITGGQSRMIPVLKKTIPISSVKKLKYRTERRITDTRISHEWDGREPSFHYCSRNL